jgi:magnesium chelatase subunit I
MAAQTLGDLKRSYDLRKLARGVKEEARENLIARLRSGERLFPGIHGYDDTVIPALVNAILARHNFILLGLRGQAKSRILRSLTELLDPEIPALPTELRDNPLHPISAEGQRLLAEAGDDAPIVWIPRSERYVEKLATPDTTVADLLGDIDPIKAARRGTSLSDLEAVHYGLLPRANRGIFAVNELADLAPKVQVALFNILQEGDVQIRGYPVRLALDVWLCFTANPQDYTARGKIVTPLKDRIGSEIRTHYPRTLEEGLAISLQEAWTAREEGIYLPPYVAEK